MRDILFKAKRIDNGEWAEGNFVQTVVASYIVVRYKHDTILGEGKTIEVDPSTICQYTGMNDKNGKKIFENDILVAHLDDDYLDDTTYEQVICIGSGFCTKEQGSDDREQLDDFTTKNFAVCGNIFDNPELMK